MDMEPKCYHEVKKCCFDLNLAILLIAFAFIIGIIIGAFIGLFVLLELGAFIAIAVILALLIVLRIIMLVCYKKEKKCC